MDSDDELMIEVMQEDEAEAVVKKINEVVVSLFFLLQMIVLSVEQPSF
jgi:hypothetical protein